MQSCGDGKPAPYSAIFVQRIHALHPFGADAKIGSARIFRYIVTTHAPQNGEKMDSLSLSPHYDRQGWRKCRYCRSNFRPTARAALWHPAIAAFVRPCTSDGGSAGTAGAISGRPPGPLSGILPSRHLCIHAHQMAEVPVLQEQFPAEPLSPTGS